MSDKTLEQQLNAAYDKMMERVHDFIEDTEQQTLPPLQKSIDHAKQQAVEFGELTKEEAEKLGYYLRRDIEDMAEHITGSGHEFSTWFSFDMQLIEDRIFDMLSKVADRTSTELNQLADYAKRSQEFHTGEITTVGTLVCQQCQTHVNFKKTNRIPPCPKCHHTVFLRLKK